MNKAIIRNKAQENEEKIIGINLKHANEDQI